MELVSNEWKAIQRERFVSEMFLQIYYELSDVEALMDASASDNGHAYYSDTAQIISEVVTAIIPYTTLEHNLWLLNGSKELVPDDDFSNSGYIGSMLSDSDGTYNEVPVISINFTKVHTYRVPGIVITWSNNFNEYARHFKLTVYNGRNIVTSFEEAENTRSEITIERDIYDYDRIEVEIYKWSLPERRPRIESIVMGIRKEYTKNDIISFKQSMEVDPISGSLPKSAIEFSLNNLNGDFDLNNIDGVGKYLIERQAIKVLYGFKKADGSFEKINAGIYYMSEWDAPQRGLQANFKARDLLEFMEKTYTKGVYRPAGITLYDLADEVLKDLDVLLNEDGTVKWRLDDCLKEITTTAPMPITTISQCMQYIAQAACCVMYCDRRGIFRINKINNDETDYEINYGNAFGYPKITLQKPLKDIILKVYNYAPKNETSSLFEGSMHIQGTKKVTLSYTSIATDAVATVTNGTLESAKYWGNACELTITAAGDVTITVTGSLIDEASSEWVVEVSEKGESQPVSNPLITSREHAEIVGQWVKNWLVKRSQYKVSYRVDPRLDAMDIIGIQDAYGTSKARNVAHSFTYTGGKLQGDSEGRML